MIQIKTGNLSFIPSESSIEYLKHQSSEVKIKELQVFFKDVFTMLNGIKSADVNNISK
jgi:hypothetical protein